MTNAYYNHVNGLPANQTRALASQVRAELDSIASGFDGVAALAFSTALPSQAGNPYKFIITNGSVATWSFIPLATSVTGTLAVANGGTGVTTSTGTGATVRASSPALITPDLGTPSAVLLSSATGLPLTTGVTGILPWANGGSLAATSVSGTTQLAIAGNHYFMQSGSLSTVTLPAAAASGDMVGVTFESALLTNVIARNGLKIMGLAEDMTVNVAYQSLILRYDDATNGWWLI